MHDVSLPRIRVEASDNIVGMTRVEEQRKDLKLLWTKSNIVPNKGRAVGDSVIKSSNIDLIISD